MGRIAGMISSITLLTVVGCISLPAADNPALVRPSILESGPDNPMFVPQGPQGYALVFDSTYDALDEYFDIAGSNRFDGRIETAPAISAGYFDLSRRSPDSYENLESTFQTIRRRAIAIITPAESGGYYIEVQVLKELEDLPQPAHSGAGAATFRTEIPIDRQYETVEPFVVAQGWIPIGRDVALEQQILAKLQECL